MIVRAVGGLPSDTGPPQGLIVDYLVHPHDADAFGALLSAAAAALIARGVNRIYAVSTLPLCQRVLRAHGFVSPSTPLLGRWVTGNVKWFTYAAQAESSTAVPGQWHLTLGDCDLDDAWVRS
jgi:hypothetical protein